MGSVAVQAGAVDRLARISHPETFSRLIDTVGPLAVILLLAVAVVISPVPSGPVAMAAGALMAPSKAVP